VNTLEQKRAEAQRWLEKRGKGLLQVKHDKDRHRRMMAALQKDEAPPKMQALRRIV
jgi:hypothetical protein